MPFLIIRRACISMLLHSRNFNHSYLSTVFTAANIKFEVFRQTSNKRQKFYLDSLITRIKSDVALQQQETDNVL